MLCKQKEKGEEALARRFGFTIEHHGEKQMAVAYRVRQEWVLDLLEPLYVALRYADTQKKCTLSGFKKTMMTAIQKMSSHLGGGSQMLDRVMSKVSPRMEDMQNETLMVAGRY